MYKRFMIALLAVIAVAGTYVTAANSSSHREAPLISQDPAVDGTDLYAFVDPNDPARVNLIANYYPFQDPSAGPNFYRFADDAQYLFHVDNNGDGMADNIFMFQFWTETQNGNTFLYNTGPIRSLTDSNWNVRQ